MDIGPNPVTYKRFNRLFFKDFWALAKPYWVSKQKYKAGLFLLINLICTFGGVYASVSLNAVTKVMFDALAEFNRPVLLSSSMEFLGLAALVFIFAGYGSYFSGLLSIHWQKWMTDQSIGQWLSHQCHYQMRWLKKPIDNPDQRITEDLASFPVLTLRIFLLLLQSISSYISFSVVLWHLSSHFPLELGVIHFEFPGYLFFSATLYGLLGLWLIGKIGKKLANIEYFQQLFNADFRHKLIHIREYSEQIALYRGENNEQDKLKSLFSKIYDNYLEANIVRKNLLFFTIGFDIFTQIVGIFLSMPLFLAKKVQFGGMMQISGAFMSVVRAFSNIVEAFTLLASWKAVVFRLTEFSHGMEEAKFVSHRIVKKSPADKNRIEVAHLHVEYPHGELMSKVANLQLEAPYRYLLTGASGSGKSTMFKVLFNLWPGAEGQMIQPSMEKIFLLPQRCYIPHGSLRDVLTYPDLCQVDDKTLKDLMKDCGLSSFIEKLHQVANWSQILSLGQQQLVGFIRLFLRRPEVILLDESSSALDEKAEAQMYDLLNQYFPEALVISIGHRRSLFKYHQHHLILDQKDLMMTKPGVVIDISQE
jgi:putative ATP-binding cassette transporter